jgi:hypothetical protein
MVSKLVAAITLAVLLVSAKAEVPSEPRVSGIYSSLRFNSEGGDLLGTELLILPREDKGKLGWSVFVQISEGAAPYTAVVPLLVDHSKFEFTLPPGGAYGGLRFTGVFENKGLLLNWESGTKEHLRRGRSYWQ